MFEVLICFLTSHIVMQIANKRSLGDIICKMHTLVSLISSNMSFINFEVLIHKSIFYSLMWFSITRVNVRGATGIVSSISLTHNKLQHLLLEYCLLMPFANLEKNKVKCRKWKISLWNNIAQGPDVISSN